MLLTSMDTIGDKHGELLGKKGSNAEGLEEPQDATERSRWV